MAEARVGSSASMTPLQNKMVLFFAAGGGAGYVPRFPGTVGTLAAIPLSLALNYLANYSLIFAAGILGAAICCAIWLAGKASEILAQKDPGVIVIDEIAGFLLANFTAPPRVSVLAAGFILFRFFDIAKIYPARRLEKLPGGIGIVLDDIMAGIYTLVIVQLLLYGKIL